MSTHLLSTINPGSVAFGDHFREISEQFLIIAHVILTLGYLHLWDGRLIVHLIVRLNYGHFFDI